MARKRPSGIRVREVRAAERSHMQSTETATRPSGNSAGEPRRVLRLVGGPLLAYHGLILVGAFVFLYGVSGHLPLWEILGVVLVAAGIALECAILLWSATLTQRSARERTSLGSTSAGGSERGHEVVQAGCVRCGRVQSRSLTVCPQCGGVCVRLPPSDAQTWNGSG